jgi:dGTPase
LDELHTVAFWSRAEEQVRARHRDITAEQLQPAVVRALIDWQVNDLLANTRQRLRQERIHGVEDVRRAAGPLVGPSEEVRTLKAALEAFLFERVYHHHKVMRMAAKGQRIVQRLFTEFQRSPELLPARYARRALAGQRERTVCDYLAGMTDRYAQDEYLRLFQPYAGV